MSIAAVASLISPAGGGATIAPSTTAKSGVGTTGLNFGSYGSAGVSTPSLAVAAIAVVAALFILKGKK